MVLNRIPMKNGFVPGAAFDLLLLGGDWEWSHAKAGLTIRCVASTERRSHGGQLDDRHFEPTVQGAAGTYRGVQPQ